MDLTRLLQGASDGPCRNLEPLPTLSRQNPVKTAPTYLPPDPHPWATYRPTRQGARTQGDSRASTAGRRTAGQGGAGAGTTSSEQGDAPGRDVPAVSLCNAGDRTAILLARIAEEAVPCAGAALASRPQQGRRGGCGRTVQGSPRGLHHAFGSCCARTIRRGADASAPVSPKDYEVCGTSNRISKTKGCAYA
jgi:hypothetical protein